MERRATAPRWPQISAIILGIAIVAAIMPIVGSPYTADDIVNSELPQILNQTETTRWESIVRMNSEFSNNAGRFFPGAISYMTLVFTTFTTLLGYKVFLLTLLLALTGAVGLWVRHSLNDVGAGLIAAASLAGSWEFRYTEAHDGLTSFVGLMPWTMLLMVCTILLLSARPGRWPGVAVLAATLVWSLSIVTYEVVVLLVPALLGSLWLVPAPRRWRRITALAILVPIVIEIAIVGWLRTHLRVPPSDEFTFNFDPGPVASTTAKQLVSALPLSQYWIAGTGRPPLDLSLGLALGAVLLASGVFFALGQTWLRMRIIEPWRLNLLMGVGAWIWLLPALLVGVTMLWQNAVVWGQSYVPVVFETLGYALVVTAILGKLRRPDTDPAFRRTVSTAVAFFLILVVSATVALTALVNHAMVW